jgi:hypothetical protein
LLAVAACDGTPRTQSEPSSDTSLSPSQRPESGSPVPVATSTCPPSAQLTGSGGLLERQGTGDGVTLWALFFLTDPVLTAGKEIKVVWRMSGSGDFSVSATGPDGTVVKPVWGPERHSGSTWNRPGEEWGTGWVFPAAGCWTVSAERTSGSAYLVLRLAA